MTDLLAIRSFPKRKLSRGEITGKGANYTRALLHGVVLSRSRRNQRRIHRLELELRLISIWREIGLRRLQEILVVAVGEVRLVMRATRFIAQARALGNHAR